MVGLRSVLIVLALLSLDQRDARRPVPGVEALVDAASAYVARYEQQLTAIVADEDYLQETAAVRARRLRSELLILKHDDFGWVEFRDVFAVDGSKIRDRDDRLLRLFLKPDGDPAVQGRRITEEGARFNLSPRDRTFKRTINTPLVALRFLRPAARHHSDFEMEGSILPAPGEPVTVRFTERGRPRLIQTPDNHPAQGTFWIEPATGRVTASLLTLDSLDTSASIRVRFAPQPGLDVWAPVTMDERYVVGRGRIMTGLAEYSNFRQYRVQTMTDIPKE
jgi:hypothetical protein